MNKILAAERMEILQAMTRGPGFKGAYVMPSTVAGEVADALKAHSAMRQFGTVIVTQTGNNLGWPNSNGTGEIGELLGTNYTPDQNSTDTTFGTTPINMFRFGSKTIKMSMELMQDSASDPLGFLLKRIGTRLGRITNRKFTIGTGLGEPLGIINAAPIGRIALPGQTMTVTYLDLVLLIGSVDEAYRQSPNCVFMMADNTLQFIRELADSNGRPLDLVKVGPDGKELLLGYRVAINPDMPVPGAAATPIAFGDFSTYVIRDLPPEEVKKMNDSAATIAGQIWYLGFARSGGGYTDVGGAVKLFKNAPA